MKYVIHVDRYHLFEENAAEIVKVADKKIELCPEFGSHMIVEDGEGADLFYKIKYNIEMFPLNEEYYKCLIRDGIVFIDKRDRAKLNLIRRRWWQDK